MVNGVMLDPLECSVHSEQWNADVKEMHAVCVQVHVKIKYQK